MTRPASHPGAAQLSAIARHAAGNQDWPTVAACARDILKQDRNSAEGWFLSGLVEKTAGKLQKAVAAFSRALQCDAARYDAAVELAFLYWHQVRNREACDLLRKYRGRLDNSPMYLDMAANTFTRLGLHADAWPLYRRAAELQPEINRFRENLAACAVLLGKTETAREIYRELLEKYPNHQRNHYELSRLGRARDRSHVEQMETILEATGQPPARNIFMYYAIGKELEDLEDWEGAFRYYRKGGDAAAEESRKAGYDVASDIAIIDKAIEVCNADWYAAGGDRARPDQAGRTPVFIVGLPRTGTTLTERIVASHSRVESADETFFMRIVLKRVSGVQGPDDMNPEILEAAARRNIRRIAAGYLQAVEYRLGGQPLFIDKFPENFLYLGFIAKAFPGGHIVHLRRNPMDACFAMYKQSYFSQAYTLDDLGRYYVAYDRLNRHWKSVLKDRVIEVQYESLVADPETQIRRLLDKLGLEFEQACLDFHLNKAPSATASAAQVREQAHTRSIHRWKRFERQLQPLREHLEAAGIEVE